MNRVPFAVFVAFFVVALAACGGSTSSGTGGELPGLADPGAGGEVVGVEVVGGDEARDDAETVAPADGVTATDGTTGLDVAPGADIVGGCAQCAYGTLNGLTCAPDGKTVVSGVTVSIDTVDCAGNPLHLEATSDAKGRYTLEGVPCGTQTVNLAKGSYKHTFAAGIEAGMDNEAANGRCFGATAAKLAVITGRWDNLQVILDNLKLKYDLYDSNDVDDSMSTYNAAYELLTDSTKLNTYDVVFVNCGKVHYGIAADPKVQANLDAFVKKGGSFYGSDYADAYVMDVWPWAMNEPDGYSIFNQTVNAEVIDPPLFAYLGTNQQKIAYMLGPIATIKSPGKNPTTGEETMVHLRGEFKEYPGEIRPIMLSFQPYPPKGGRVVYANFHHDEQTGALLSEVAKILNYVVFDL